MEINGVEITTHAIIPEVARLTDLEASVLFTNILYWCDINRQNGVNYHDGRYWMYITIEKMAAAYIYLSEKQVETRINKLRKAGLILVGRYNRRTNDRTNWYAISDAGYALIGCSAPSTETEITKSPNKEMDVPKKGNAYPDIRTSLQNVKKTKRKKSNTYDQFADFANDDT